MIETPTKIIDTERTNKSKKDAIKAYDAGSKKEKLKIHFDPCAEFDLLDRLGKPLNEEFE